MNYAGYVRSDDANGEGMRVSLFVSGCNHHCNGCFNKESWKYSYGDLYDEAFEDKLIEDLDNDYINGLSLLGGDPLMERNTDTILALCKRVKRELPHKTICLWTGFTLEEVKQDEKKNAILPYIDTLIDGKFVLGLVDPTLKWRGSSNQNIIDVKQEL